MKKLLPMILSAALAGSLASCAAQPKTAGPVELYVFAAASASLTVVDTANAGMCGQAIYPAAVLKDSQHPDEAKAFLAYLQTDAAAQVFEGVGFTPIR